MRFLLFLISFSLFIPTPLFAASFIIDGPSQVTNNSLFKVDILVDTENTEINALGGTVSYQGDGLILEDIKSGGSLVSLWLDEPILEKSLNGRLEFNGIIPGAYNGHDGYLFSLIFKNNYSANSSSNNVKISLADLKVFLNNGEGTELKARAVSKIINLTDNQAIASTTYQTVVDKFPPEKFIPLIYNNPSGPTNNLFIAFSTTDKQSGISFYEIAKNQKLTNNYQRLSWTKATSPQTIETSDLKQFIYIKAVDRQGNFRVVVINPTVVSDYSRFNKLIFGASVLLILIIILLIIRRMLKNR